VTAAVLVAVVDRTQPTILLTQRTQHLRSHAGQIALPGGKIDPEDASPRDAALREAEEEIGLDRHFVEPLGYLDVYPTRYGVRVLPLLARVQPDFPLKINPDEVDDAFEVPLAFLMDPENHRIANRVLNGAERSFYEMPFGDRYIWGATAGMLRALYERLYLR
jgi:8-oxo-dGTP pyrophosphatase MutT (NUDIX family)